MNEMNQEKNGHPVGAKRWRYLAVSAVGLLFVGIIYAWSILKVPFSAEFGWEPSKLAFNYTLTMCFFSPDSAGERRADMSWILPGIQHDRRTYFIPVSFLWCDLWPGYRTCLQYAAIRWKCLVPG